MTAANRFVFMPCFSITPTQVTTFNKIFYRSPSDGQLKSPYDFKRNRKVKMRETTKDNEIKKQFHGFKISDNAYRTLKKKINWLHYLAKPKQVTTYSGKKIYNFKCAFLTFTLPAAQVEPTKEVTNLYFNQMLTELRTVTKMQNYVWRLEFQKNGNVHYHLVTDTYIDYNFLLKTWNRILSKGSYIARFQAKFSKMSLSQYRNYVDPEHKREFKKIAQTYYKNKAGNWTQPNSVDVKSVINNNSISNYIAKYFAKDDDNNPIKNPLDNSTNSESVRLWFCSRSLSKLNTVTDFCEAVNFSAVAIVDGVKTVRKKAFRYATVFYFEISKLPAFCKKTLAFILKDYAKRQGYQPSI